MGVLYQHPGQLGFSQSQCPELPDEIREGFTDRRSVRLPDVRGENHVVRGDLADGFGVLLNRDMVDLQIAVAVLDVNTVSLCEFRLLTNAEVDGGVKRMSHYDPAKPPFVSRDHERLHFRA